MTIARFGFYFVSGLPFHVGVVLILIGLAVPTGDKRWRTAFAGALLMLGGGLVRLLPVARSS